jgi:hypothetical protein
MENYVINEFFSEREAGIQKEFDSFDKVKDFMKYFNNGSYPTCYKNEPPYPYVWVRVEEQTINGPRDNRSYCYYAK